MCRLLALGLEGLLCLWFIYQLLRPLWWALLESQHRTVFPLCGQQVSALVVGAGPAGGLRGGGGGVGGQAVGPGQG